MTLAILFENKGPSAVCQQKSRTALTLNYLYGLNSFKTLSIRRAIVGAPLSDSTGKRTQEKNGAVYRCHINGNLGCINTGIDDNCKFAYESRAPSPICKQILKLGSDHF